MSLLPRFLRPPISRPAFLIHTSEIANHFAPVWKELDSVGFDVLLLDGAELPGAIQKEYRSARLRKVRDILVSGDRYAVLVSTNPVKLQKTRGFVRKALIQRLAVTNVRMMYAAGKARWNLSDWNTLYDGVLCFGPHHAAAFREAFGLPVAEMGYPRFDKYYNLPANRDTLCADYGCDPAKPTVVWLPTWKGLSSVGHYDDEVAALLQDFNVVVKVHPLMPDDEPEKVKALEDRDFNALITDTSDNVSLYQLADYMLFDYGGPAFGAIYTDKRFILLNVPNAEDDVLAGPDSPDVKLRKTLLSVEPDGHSLSDHLKNGPHWDTHAKEVAELSRVFFADNRGTSAKAAAEAILDRSWLVAKGQ